MPTATTIEAFGRRGRVGSEGGCQQDTSGGEEGENECVFQDFGKFAKEKMIENPVTLSSNRIKMYIYKNIITVEPGKRSGKPCIRGMRITVEDILRWLASDMSFEDILADFPELTKEDLVAALEFAAMRQQRTAIAA